MRRAANAARRHGVSQIGATVTIAVPDIDAVMEDYTSIQLYSASTFGGSYSLVTTITLVADTTEYVYLDASGTSSTWYKHRWYTSTGPVASAYSEPYPGQTSPTTSRQTLRQQAAERLGLYLHPDKTFTFPGASFTTTSAGSTTTVVCTSFVESLLSNDGTGTTSKLFDGAYLYLSSGSASGEEARVGASGLNVSTGTFTVAPAYSAASGSGTTVEGYLGGISASLWNRFLDDSRVDLWYPATAYLTGIASQTEYAAPYWIERDEQILRIDRQYGSTIRQHTLTYGFDFTFEPAEGGGGVIRFAGAPGANTVYVVRAMRHPAPFTSDTAAIPLSEQYQRLWWLTAALRACQYLAQAPDRVVENTKQWQDKAAALDLELKGLHREIGAWRTQRSPRRTPMAYVGGGSNYYPLGATSRYY